MDHPPNKPLEDRDIATCPNCDYIQHLKPLQPGEVARCARCDSELWRPRRDSINRTFALAIAALVFFLIANMMPMLGIRAVGAESYTTVFRGTELLWEHGQKIVAIMVFIAAILAPGLQILFMLLLLLGAWQESPPLWVGTLLRRIPMIQVWSMIEVMLLGVMVSLTKIAEYAAVLPGHALFALGALLVVLTAMQSTFDAREVWGRVQWVHGKEIPIGSRLTEEAR